MRENLMRGKIINMIEHIELTGMCKDLTSRICLLLLDARKFSCTKISMFTVFCKHSGLRFVCQLAADLGISQ